MEHKFNNCTAWAKGWYEMREHVTAWWMDLAHCINNDGYCCITTKAEVVNWILMRFDEDVEWWKNEYCRFGFADMNDFINRNINWYYTNEKLSYQDGIILYFRMLLSMKSNDCFRGGYRPNNDVLPLMLHKAYYNDGTYNNGIPTYEPAEMMCDAITRIEKMFPELPDQKVQESDNFENIEAQLSRKDYREVYVPTGYDTSANLKKMYTGKQLTRKDSILLEGITNEYGDKEYADMMMFSDSIGFDENKTYQVFIEEKKVHHNWTDYSYTDTKYTVKNIKEMED